MTLPSKPGYTVSPPQGNPQQPNVVAQKTLSPFDTRMIPSGLGGMPPGAPPTAMMAAPYNDYGLPPFGAGPPPMADPMFAGFRAGPAAASMGQPSMAQPSMHQDPERGLLSDIAALDQISAEEVMEKKRRAQEHLYHPLMHNLITELMKLSPFPPHTFHPPPGSLDFGLSSFLQSQGIEADEKKATGPNADPQYAEFMAKFSQLRSRYEVELSKLNRVCSEFCNRLVTTLREQRAFRFVSDAEVNLKVGTIQQRFDYVRSQLRQNVCNAIVLLQRQYNQVKKTRRSLSKKATEVLTQWFFEHINDPYPSDEEKAMLATQCSLTLNQVNNWFGNKRIRYKRKCLEEEAKRAKDSVPSGGPSVGGGPGGPQGGVPPGMAQPKPMPGMMHPGAFAGMGPQGMHMGGGPPQGFPGMPGPLTMMHH